MSDVAAKGPRWIGWNEEKQVPLASRDRRRYKPSICASPETKTRPDNQFPLDGTDNLIDAPPAARLLTLLCGITTVCDIHHSDE